MIAYAKKVETTRANSRRLFLRNGEQWWRWQVAARTVTTNTVGDPGERAYVGDAAGLIVGHGRLVISADVEIVGRESIAGRKALAVQIPDREFLIDEEHGPTLRASYQDRLLLEVGEIAYDVAIPEERFEMESLPPGIAVRAASNLFDELPVDEIAALVDFPVFAPTDVIIGWPVAHATRFPATAQRPEIVNVSLRPSPIWIHHSVGADPESFGQRFGSPDEWRQIERGGVEFEITENPTVVRFEREGVTLEINGEGKNNLEELLTIALSLQPVTPAPSN